MKEIFEALKNDARLTPDQISKMTGIALSKVQKTIQKAEKDGTILKYKTVINWEKLGQEEVLAIIEVKVTPQRSVGFDAIARRIYRYPQAVSVYLTSGTYDLAILVSGRTMHDIANFVSEKLAPLDAVQSTVTHFILKKYKEDGQILAAEPETKRLPVTP
ncbi:MAG TPA: Lrp/AsnC family transcriptional regulator [Dehalococcoidia bacterium]|nr:Lrp/AsnC family transcriptional regulator [Dehalococcoidia bacterium]